MKLFTVNNNYLLLIKILTNNESHNWNSLNDISLTCDKTIKSHLVVKIGLYWVATNTFATKNFYLFIYLLTLFNNLFIK